MSDQAATACAVLLDLTAEPRDRVAALVQLAALDTERAFRVAISVTENADESRDVLVALGEQIARIASKTRWLTEFEVRNMRDAAFDAYCEHLE